MVLAVMVVVRVQVMLWTGEGEVLGAFLSSTAGSRIKGL